MKKIKIFLGAYIDYPNAQNVNCLNLAKQLDKEIFDVYALTLSRKNKRLLNKEIKKVRLFNVYHRRYIWQLHKLFIMIFSNCDIYYLPKIEPADIWIAKLFKGRKKFISSIEGVVGEQIETDCFFKYYHMNLMSNTFSISNCIKNSVEKNWNRSTEVIYLGYDEEFLITKEPEIRNSIKTVIWIGSMIKRKRPNFLLECAKSFPNLSFYMIGDGELFESLQSRIKNENINNVTLLGRIENREVYKLLYQSDLLLMTSDKEGLPKVILEAAACCVPSVYIKECYEVDYILDGVNGFGVEGLDEMIDILNNLIVNPEKINYLKINAMKMSQEYSWTYLKNQYNDFFRKQLD